MKGNNMQLIRKNNGSERGQTLLEFALVLPFLMVLGVGVVDVGRAIYYTIAVNNAAAAGNRRNGRRYTAPSAWPGRYRRPR